MARGSRRLRREEAGQATVEYLLVLAAFLAMVLAMGAIVARAREGALVERAVAAASHTAADGVVGEVRDVLLY